MRRLPKPILAARGFTLVELLVVILIIAALAAVAFSVAPKIRSRSNLSKSLQNMRQLGSLIAIYASDNNSSIPAIKALAVDSSGKKTEVDWYIPLLGMVYTDASRPSLSDFKWWELNKPFLRNPVWPQANFKPWFHGYALNHDISYNLYPGAAGGGFGTGEGPDSRAVPLSKITEPSRTPLISTTKNWFYRGSTLAAPENKPLLVDGKLPFLFVDGHVESMKSTEYISRELNKMPRN